MSDHGHLSFYEGHKERRTGKIRGAFSGMHRALDGWMLAHAQTSPAQGLHHRPRYFIFPFFLYNVPLKNLEYCYLNWLERNLTGLLLRTLVVGRRQQSESIEVTLSIYGVRRFDELFCYWPVPLLVESYNFLLRFGSLLVKG